MRWDGGLDYDLAISKILAGREKDMDFVFELVRLRVVSIETLRHRLEEIPGIAKENQKLAKAWLATLESAQGGR